MAWTSPTTASAGAVLTAASWNAQVKGNMNALLPLDALAWSSYTPTLTQSGAVTKTVTYAKYTRIGNWVRAVIVLTCTGSGTANNPVTVGLPVTAASSVIAGIGSGRVYDSSGNLYYPCVATIASTTTFTFIDTIIATAVNVGQTGSSFAVALASPDVVYAEVSYEAA